MNDYRERERIRRMQIKSNNKTNKKSLNQISSIDNNFERKSIEKSTRKAAKELIFGPGGKRMPKAEIRKQINFQNKKVGLSAINTNKLKKIENPINSRNLSEQRAEYFESLLKQQNEQAIQRKITKNQR